MSGREPAPDDRSQVLDLSFIGWGIVGSLCLGVGTLWVMTYMAATEAQYYEYLTSGRTSPEF